MAGRPQSQLPDRGRRGSTSSNRSTYELRQMTNRDESPDDAYTDDYSSQDNAPTRARNFVKASYGGQSYGFPAAEREDYIVFEKFFRNPKTPRMHDIEALAGQSSNHTLNQYHGRVPTGPDSRGNPQPFDILHNWGQSEENGRVIANINLLQQRDGGQSNIVWLHVRDNAPSLGKLESHFKASLEPRLPATASSIRRSTYELLKKVRTKRERQFALGKYMKTGPVRYDSISPVSDDPDDPCMFLSFPYFAIGIGKPNTKDEHDLHPTRTLLQSRFRLQSTKKMDENQAITSLSARNVQQCIRSVSTTPLRGHSKKWTEKIYVPQLWVLSVAGDMMITNGPISTGELLGDSLRIAPSKTPDHPELVEFLVEYEHGRFDTFLYPSDRCESFFGLKNKKRRILATLGEKDRRRKDAKPQNPKGKLNVLPHYKLYWRDQKTGQPEPITIDNWIAILRECADSKVDRVSVMMQRDRPRNPKFQLDSSQLREKKESASDTITDDQGRRHNVAIPKSTAVNSHLSPHPAQPNVKAQGNLGHRRSRSHSTGGSSGGVGRTQPSDMIAFFLWPFEEESEPDKRHTATKRLNAWLNKVAATAVKRHAPYMHPDLIEDYAVSFRDLDTDVPTDFPAVCGCTMEDFRSRYFAQPPKVALPSADPAKQSSQRPTPSASIGPVSTITDPVASDSGRSPEADGLEKLFSLARFLLQLFVPKRGVDTRSSGPPEHQIISLYWGLFHQIGDYILQGQLVNERLTTLLESLKEITDAAEKIHKGVQKHRRKTTDGRSDQYAVENVEFAVIISPIPAALEYIVDLLFDIVKWLHDDKSIGPTVMTFEDQVRHGSELVLTELKTAKRLLIARADDSLFEKTMGPVVTSEAISLLLIERLSHGVYRHCSVNITDIYEQIVEKLTSKVEARPSRHLLFEINRVSSELDVVLDVLNQQQRFLTAYHTCLEPEGFWPPSIKRHTRFPFESNTISRIDDEVKERISDTKDLKYRIEQLADRNIKLVESYQDDNNRTLMLFTLVTITFLPLSFFTGFFGMNVKGVVDTEYTVTHFWIIAAPVTAGVVIVSLVLTYWNQTLRNLHFIARKIRLAGQN